MPDPTNISLYADRRTLAVLNGEVPPGSRGHVLLIGSYLGYPNFGDILQLKGVIEYHRARTRLEPVVVVDVAALADAGHLDRMRAWFGVDALLVASGGGGALDPSALGLAAVASAPRIETLHLNGGGFLNRLWGRFVLDIVGALIDRFKVVRHVVSGQQVEPEFAPELGGHFRRYPPAITGGRDERSAEVLGSIGVRAAHSFDDAAEGIVRLAGQLRPRPGAPSAANYLLHMNISPYTLPGDQNPANALDEVVRDLACVAARSGAEVGSQVTLLHAYNDVRIHDVADTLGVVQRLDDRFPFADCRALQLWSFAYQFGARTPLALSPLTGSPIGIVSSYHVAMLCASMGAPCLLRARNSYYRQKNAGLGMPELSVSDFLAAPVVTSLERQFEARAKWLKELDSAFEAPPQAMATPAQPTPRSGAPVAAPPWTPKGHRADVVARERERFGVRAAQLEEEAKSANRRASEAAARADAVTAERDATQTEASRLADGWTKQKTHLDEIGRVKDQMWAELQGLKAGRDAAQAEATRLADGWRKQSETIRSLESTLQAERTELGSVRAHCELASGKVRELESAEAALRADLENLRSQIEASRAHANELAVRLARSEAALAIGERERESLRAELKRTEAANTDLTQELVRLGRAVEEHGTQRIVRVLTRVGMIRSIGSADGGR